MRDFDGQALTLQALTLQALELQALGAQACRDCGLAETRRQAVFGSGPIRARLMVIGEAPGVSEDEGGAPFIGRSGRLLIGLLEEEVGLTRSDIYIANTVKCRPPKNRTPTAKELHACAPRLRAQVASVAPEVLLCVGATAQRSVTGNRSAMRDVHGQVFASKGGVPAVVTYHPAAALRSGSRIVEAMRADLGVLGALLNSKP